MSDETKMQEAVDFYLEHSKVKSNGVREVPKAAFVQRLKDGHDIGLDDYKKLDDALSFEITAAARVSLLDTEAKIGEATKEQLADEEWRKGTSSTTRLPTLGGATEVQCVVEKHNRIPARGEEEAGMKIDYGRFRTTINAKARIHKDLHEEAADRIKKHLKIK